MGRRRRSYRRYQRREVDYQWFPLDAQFAVTGTASGDVIKVGDITLPDINLEWTLERVRGEFVYDLKTTPSAPVIGYLYGLIFPDVVYGSDDAGTKYNSTTNSDRIPPLPSDHEGSDDFPLVTPLCIVPGNPAAVFGIDSKARRRMDSEHLLTLFLHQKSSDTTLGDVNIAMVSRTLFRKRG